MKKDFRILLSCLLLAAFSLAIACSKGGGHPTAGSRAPDFSLHDLDAKPVRLSELRGKVVFLNFWATWCHFCLEEAPSLSRLNAAMRGKDFEMVTVSMDEGREDVEAFFRVSGLRLPTALDPGGKVAKRYGVAGVPETFIIDGKGVVRKRIVGAMAWDDPEMIAYLDDLIKR